MSVISPVSADVAEAAVPEALSQPRLLGSSERGTRMSVVAAETHETLSGISGGDLRLLETAMGLREAEVEATGLDPRACALAKIAALIALGAPPACYAWQVANAVDDGVTPEHILGILCAVAPLVGGAKIVAAAPEIMVALGLPVPENAEYGERRYG